MIVGNYLYSTVRYNSCLHVPTDIEIVRRLSFSIETRPITIMPNKFANNPTFITVINRYTQVQGHVFILVVFENAIMITLR